ncbi:clp1-related protein, putative [Plasmodium relictum]|uniref:Clp1-related protein, putative n=1 Tax=Plasmodium relictum TaxID=85471 RepID=A0A1J1H5J2_PLARL|nr:clp1-related protein, putative [Plasmodium relictum]CRG98865.1 clp1-related protein, putative [Plasmodium relictum]
MTTTNNTRIYNLKAFRELRIVTLEKATKFDEKEECIKIRILSNTNLNKNEKNTCTAEIFGRELILDKDYYFGFNEKFSIYTYTGCIIQIKGKTLQEYESKNTTMKDYLSLSYIFDAYRKLAKKKKKVGPRILITGNNNSGKSSVSLLLCNYALKSGFKPIFIETDTKCSCDKIELNNGPGIMSCFVYDNMNMKYSLDFFFGYLDINEDINLYYHINECLSSCIHLMLLNNLNFQSTNFKNNTEQEIIHSSGFILNVPSEADHKIIENLIEIYNINIVVVIDNSFLHYSLKEHYNKIDANNSEGVNCGSILNNNNNKGTDFNNDDNNLNNHDSNHNDNSNNNNNNVADNNNEKIKNSNNYNNVNNNNNDNNKNKNINNDKIRNVEIIGMPKFEGVIPSDNNRLRYCRNLWFYNYFSKDIYVNGNVYKKSHILNFKYSSTNFVKLDTNSAVPLSALPADCKNKKIENVSVSLYNSNIKNLINCILGVSYSKDFLYVHLMNIAAFVHVQNIKEIESEENEENKNDYLIEILCPVSITSNNIPPYFIVPGNIKQIKF